MNNKIKGLLFLSSFLILVGCSDSSVTSKRLEKVTLARKYFQEDSAWYLQNIPFFECSDKQLEEVYYYRWKLYKAHIRNVGTNQFVITEFINDVHWDIDPYSTINAATMHHINEGRWLREDRYLNGYINYMYHDGGNNRQYSESIADATYSRYLVNADSNFLFQQLNSMKKIYEGWYDHRDSTKNIYYIPAMPDATEYTIASIDASGGKDGFEGGDAFRPTINSYMYGNALAISKTAALKGDKDSEKLYLQRAQSLKEKIETNLWNASLEHFTDRYKVNNKFVHYWDFIRGRELAGFAPWYFNLPKDTPVFNAAWRHAIDTTQLLGKFGLRTNEPSYEYYFKQFVFTFGKPGSQWNGPSWPYQSSMIINAMANLLNNYKHHTITVSDYLRLLKLFAQQHYLPNGKIDLVENYDPNMGGPIVHFYWSNHYNHSSFNDLIITGLCGIHPSEGDTVVINPLVDNSIKYFFLHDILYHGHKLSVVYDAVGTKYNLGKGLTIFVDGSKTVPFKSGNKYKVIVGPPLKNESKSFATNYSLNIRKKDFPVPSASVNSAPDSLFQAIDGRIWYFPEITNMWTTAGSNSRSDWYSIDFGEPHDISILKLYLVAHDNFGIPKNITFEYYDDKEWLPIKVLQQMPTRLVGNSVTQFNFENVKTSKIKVNFEHKKTDVAVTEIECY